MFDDWFHLIVGWIVSMYIPVVPLGLDIAYPAELQNLCDLTADKWELFLTFSLLINRGFFCLAGRYITIHK